MQDHIEGTTMPVLVVELQQGEAVITEHGELSWMSPNIAMAPQKGQGIMGRISRAVAGGGFGVTRYEAANGPGTVAFAAKLPGRIFPVDLSTTGSVMVHRDGWLCGTPDVQVSIGFQQSFGSGLFSGTGFMLEKLDGAGRAWLELSGEIIQYDLQPGQQMLVHPGHVGAFSASVNCSLSRIHGVSNILFGKDGFFLASLTGPGTVWLQTMSLPQLAGALAPYLPGNSAGGDMTAGAAGGVIGSLLSGRGI